MRWEARRSRGSCCGVTASGCARRRSTNGGRQSSASLTADQKAAISDPCAQSSSPSAHTAVLTSFLRQIPFKGLTKGSTRCQHFRGTNRYDDQSDSTRETSRERERESIRKRKTSHTHKNPPISTASINGIHAHTHVYFGGGLTHVAHSRAILGLRDQCRLHRRSRLPDSQAPLQRKAEEQRDRRRNSTQFAWDCHAKGKRTS